MSQGQQNQRSLGLWMSTSLVLGTMIGSGVYLLPSSMAQQGTISLIGWGITTMGAICLALVFANLARAFPKAGGPYTYSREAFGDLVGFQVAWSYWSGCWSGNAAIAVSFIGYMATFFPVFNDDPSVAFIATNAVVWGITLINIIGVREAGIVQVVTTVLKVVPLVIIAFVGIAYVKVDNILPLAPAEGITTVQAIVSSVSLTLWAFLGLEAATVPADNVKDPEKTIPRATILGVLFAAGLYILTTISIMGIIPAAQLAQSSAPFVDATRMIFGHWSGWLVAASAAISCIGALNGWILLQGQIPLAAARDGLFPHVFAYTNKKGSPVFGLVFSSVLISIMLYMNYGASLVSQFTFIVSIGTLTILIPYLYASMAELYLFVTHRSKFGGKAIWKHVFIASVGFAYAIFAVAGTGAKAVYMVALLLFASIPVYVYMRYSQHRIAKK